MNINGYIQLDCNTIKKGKILPFFEKVDSLSNESQFAKDYYDIDENGYYSFNLEDEQFLGLDAKYSKRDNIYILAIIDDNLEECKKESENARYFTINHINIGKYESSNNFICYEKRKPIIKIISKNFENEILNKKEYKFRFDIYLDENEIVDSCFNNNENEIYKYKDFIFFDGYLLKEITISIDNIIYQKEFEKEDEVQRLVEEISFKILETGNKTITIKAITYQNQINEYNIDILVKENLEPYLELKVDHIPYINETVQIKSNNIDNYYNENTKITHIDFYINDKLILSTNENNFEIKYTIKERITHKLKQVVTYENNGKFYETEYIYNLEVKNTKPNININKIENALQCKKVHFIINAIDPDKIGINELNVFILDENDNILYKTDKNDFEYIFTQEGSYKLKVTAKDDLEYSDKECVFEIKFDQSLYKIVNMEEIAINLSINEESVTFDQIDENVQINQFEQEIEISDENVEIDQIDENVQVNPNSTDFVQFTL